jgi:hypothetical protein
MTWYHGVCRCHRAAANVRANWGDSLLPSTSLSLGRGRARTPMGSPHDFFPRCTHLKGTTDEEIETAHASLTAELANSSAGSVPRSTSTRGRCTCSRNLHKALGPAASVPSSDAKTSSAWECSCHPPGGRRGRARQAWHGTYHSLARSTTPSSAIIVGPGSQLAEVSSVTSR